MKMKQMSNQDYSTYNPETHSIVSYPLNVVGITTYLAVASGHGRDWPIVYDYAYDCKWAGPLFAHNNEMYGGHNAYLVDDILRTKFAKRKISNYSAEGEEITEEEFGDLLMQCIKANNWRWNGLFDTLDLEYDPLDNVNEITDITEKTIDDGSDNRTLYDGEHVTTTVEGTIETNHGVVVSDNENYVVPFDKPGVESLQNHQRNTVNQVVDEVSQTTPSTVTTSMNPNDKSTDNLKHDLTRDFEHHVRRHGNIGVTTNFQLISGERDIKRWSLCNEIAQDIVNYICTKGWFDGEDD